VGYPGSNASGELSGRDNAPSGAARRLDVSEALSGDRHLLAEAQAGVMAPRRRSPSSFAATLSFVQVSNPRPSRSSSAGIAWSKVNRDRPSFGVAFVNPRHSAAATKTKRLWASSRSINE